MIETDYKSKYEELCKKLMHEFTPGGSEFWMDPDRCIRFGKMQLDEADNDMRHTRRLLNRSRFLRWLWRQVERKYKEETQCQKRH